MCGIVGLLSKHRRAGFFGYHADLFQNMLIFDSIRGDDSTGVFGVDGQGNVDLMKGDANGYVFTHSLNFAKFKTRINKNHQIVIGHNRKATKGSIKASNAHPFAEGNIILVHNGTIRNASTLNNEVEVDSHAIAHALNDNNAAEAIASIDGAFALVWYDKEAKTLQLCRNKERPLFLLEYADFWAISSEAGLPLWLNRRENRKELKVIDVPTDKILCFKLTDLHREPEEVPYNEYKKYSSNWTPVPPAALPITSAAHQKPVVALKDLLIPKAGQKIKIQFNDYRDIEYGNMLIGNPVFDNIIDSNIIVKCPLINQSQLEKMKEAVNKTEFFVGTVRSIGMHSGIPIIFVNYDSLSPVSTYKTYNGVYLSSTEADAALKNGCGRCKDSIVLHEIADTLVKKRSDGTYRTLCAQCVLESLANAEKRKKVKGGLHLVQ